MKPEISTIIFSKNRACQLELLLRSLSMPATVIYTYDPEFRAGYEKLFLMYPHVRFLREQNLKEQVIQNMGEYVMFEVDDAVMIEPFTETCREFLEFKKNPNILCLSLRMAPYYANAPVLRNNTWNWISQKDSWGYPMAVGSTIFRKCDIISVIRDMEEFVLPHDLERELRNHPPDRPLMFCFDRPKLITNEANIVQTRHQSRNIGISAKWLEERFMQGERLSLHHIRETAKNATDCFIRVPYQWERKKENRWLSEYKKNVTSQRGEDGILEKIFELIEVPFGWCADVGAYGKKMSNTYSLMAKGWSGVFVEQDENRAQDLKKLYDKNDKAFVVQKKAEVVIGGAGTLDEIFSKTPLPKHFDLLSIDVDGNDYYLWQSLQNYSPSVVIIEFNPVLKLDEYIQKIDGQGGSSLVSLVKLGWKKGYELIATTTINAIFVKKELFYRFEIENNSAEELFVDSNESYGGDRTRYKTERRESGF